MLLKIVIRKIEKKDLKAIKSILSYWLIDYQRIRNRKTYPNHRDEYFEFIKESLIDPSKIFFVALYNKKVVGFLGYTTKIDPTLKKYAKTTKPVWLRFLFAHRHYLRKKVGTILVNTVISDIIKKSFTEALFFSHERFYQSSLPFHNQRDDFSCITEITHHGQKCKIFWVNLKKLWH